MTDPLVTVIMPVRNEQAFIWRSLGAVLNQDYPVERIEVILADGMSTDNTCAIARMMATSEWLQIIDNPGRSQAAGLNVAIRQARGAIIVRVDGHTIIAEDYVRQCVAALQRSGAANVGGPMEPVGTTPLGKAIAAAAKSPFAVPSAFRTSRTEQYTDTVYMGAWPREALERLGGFNEHVGVNEDYELNYRLRKAGLKILLSPLIRSEYYGRETWSALARQYYRYGTSKALTARLHPASLRARHLIAPLCVVGFAGGLALLPFYAPVRLAWLALLSIYALVNVVFSMRAWEGGWHLPLIFAIIHAAWGLGFVIGLLRREQGQDIAK